MLCLLPSSRILSGIFVRWMSEAVHTHQARPCRGGHRQRRICAPPLIIVRPYALIRIIMNFKFPNISGLSNGPSAFRKMRRPEHRPVPAGVLSVPDLRRIVAEMVG